MMSYIDVFCPSVEFGVLGKFQCGGIVNRQGDCILLWVIHSWRDLVMEAF